MAVSNGTVWSVETIKADDRDPLQFAAVYFNLLAQTYAQANGGILTGIAALINASRRNGKTITLQSAAIWQPARKLGVEDVFFGLKTVAIAGADITFKVTLGAGGNALDLATEFTDATLLPAQGTPFGLLVGFTEA
jgi:hypothetical protein